MLDVVVRLSAVVPVKPEVVLLGTGTWLPEAMTASLLLLV